MIEIFDRVIFSDVGRCLLNRGILLEETRVKIKQSEYVHAAICGQLKRTTARLESMTVGFLVLKPSKDTCSFGLSRSTMALDSAR